MTKQEKIMQLLGVKSSDEQKSIQKLLDNLVESKANVDPQSFDKNMTTLLTELGAPKLSGEQRKDLAEKLCIIVDVSANTDVPLLLDGKVNKDYFNWTPNQEITLDKNYSGSDNSYYKLHESYLNSASKQTKNTKIDKNQFHWGSRLNEQDDLPEPEEQGQKFVFFNRSDHKILMSDTEDYPEGYKLTDEDMVTLIDQGFALFPIDTTNESWRNTMMRKHSQL